MLLYGASGHAKVIISCLESEGKSVKAIFDDDPDVKNLLGHEVVGSYNGSFSPETPLLISIGNNLTRMKVSKKINHKYGMAIHRSAIVDKNASIGEGTVVMHNATLQSGVTVGKHSIMNTACSVDHDCKIGDFVHISPGVTLSGNVSVGDGTHIGAGASVIPNLKIGKWVTIGAGTVIIRDIPDFAVVVGNPGKIIKYRNENLL